ncbi:MAG: BrnT family toxin [Chloroflexi bacterium]|nr:BrnT family toxin [Chloroflexota bacterium]
MEFEWDPQKAAKNLRKHKVSFAEAATVFGDPLSATVSDPDHSDEEDRYIIVGMSYRFRLLIVAFAERGDRIRIISARELTRAERKAYEQETSK